MNRQTGSAGKLVNSWNVNAGRATITWNVRDSNGNNLAPSIYYCTITNGKAKFTTKIHVAR